jgi:hypothetical protein
MLNIWEFRVGLHWITQCTQSSLFFSLQKCQEQCHVRLLYSWESSTINSVRKKSYKKCRRKYSISFPSVLVSQKSSMFESLWSFWSPTLICITLCVYIYTYVYCVEMESLKFSVPSRLFFYWTLCNSGVNKSSGNALDYLRPLAATRYHTALLHIVKCEICSDAVLNNTSISSLRWFY